MVTSLLSNNVIIVLFTTITFLVLQVNITTVEMKLEFQIWLWLDVWLGLLTWIVTMTMNVLVSDAGSVSLMLSGEICPGGALGPELLTISISNDSVWRTILLLYVEHPHTLKCHLENIYPWTHFLNLVFSFLSFFSSRTRVKNFKIQFWTKNEFTMTVSIILARNLTLLQQSWLIWKKRFYVLILVENFFQGESEASQEPMKLDNWLG